MLEAATDAAKSLEAALHGVRITLGQLVDVMILHESTQPASDSARRARESIAAADDIGGRVDLLFGLESGEELRKARSLLARSMSEAAREPDAMHRAFGTNNEAERRIAENYGRFKLVPWWPRA